MINDMPRTNRANVKDDRSDSEMNTHTCYVKARDTFLSGWGQAEGGTSYAIWACRPEHLDTVFDWVKGRGDMQRVSTSTFRYEQLRGDNDQLHIYVVNEGHPSLGGGE